jgi:DNA-binding SARP family transcriptional activator
MASIEISFFFGTVRLNGIPVRLPDKEMELLFTVAAAGTINGEKLMDLLWPDVDGDAAHNSFRVCLHRLRKHINHGPIIRRVGKAYELDGNIAVDLQRTHRAAPAETDEIVNVIRAGHASRVRLGTWFERFENVLWDYAARCRRGRTSDLVRAE